MKLHNAQQAAASAVSARPDRPATAIVHDSPDARLVVFRIEAGQVVAPHASSSTVILSVVDGNGIISGGTSGDPVEREVTAGDIVVFEPDETHGMRAVGGTLTLVATITPRPGEQRISA